MPAGLGNHLWQSTLFAAVGSLVAVLLRNNRAQFRHWIWLLASVKFLIPFSLLISIGSRFGGGTAAAIMQPQISIVVEQISQPFTTI